MIKEGQNLLVAFSRRYQEVGLLNCGAKWRPDCTYYIALGFALSTKRTKPTIFHEVFAGRERSTRGYLVTFPLITFNGVLKSGAYIIADVKCEDYRDREYIRFYCIIYYLGIIKCVVWVHHLCPSFMRSLSGCKIQYDLVNFKASRLAAPSANLAERLEPFIQSAHLPALIPSATGGMGASKAA